ncbi:AbrB/MazE/SpoVT family DNA-binding domain-containing protein [Chamaesiphon sp. OTE_20_metabat_361]|uniref:AbrB/MazE/SpoVT family DNA-binding domain-containing protein n=1 Tax=Chamaesiphon sp. OTE_20_metabat_361 TaxID=2964689 RepID=UPI00286A1A1F|nr:AbrB/MazE/SpoVT family DNA-binding domain-containing protein [Chamaesiphon sp. OTE_20_metabat_361]
MTEIVNKWGNSLGVRIPQPVATEIGLTVGTEVNVEVVNNKIVISPVKKKYQLEDLLVGVTPELIGGEYDWGKPVCKLSD